MDAVRIESLTVAYGTKLAVEDASWRAPRGEITVVMGPNGAGKTSTFRVCAGLIRPTSGSVRVWGQLPTDRGLRPRVGVMLPSGGFYPSVTARRALTLLAGQYTNPQPIEALAERVELSALDTPYRRMSSGEQRRLSLAAALIGRPDVLIADEPSSGLDPAARHRVWDLFAELRKAGVSVVVSTHLSDEAQAIADHLVLYRSGHVVATGAIADFLGDEDVLRFRAGAGLPLDTLRTALPPHTNVDENSPGHYTVEAATPELAATVTSWCAAHGISISELRIGRKSLEDVYLELTNGA